MADFRVPGPAFAFPRTVLIPSAALGVLSGLWLRTAGTGWSAGFGAPGAGLLAWTLAEYVLHRFILHRVEPFKSWHIAHHRQPDVPMRTPVLFSLMLVFALLAMPPALWGNTGFALGFSGGLLLGHLAQELVHYRLHGAEPEGQGWLAARWRHHDFHHHTDDSQAFGTLSSFWDRQFGTQPQR
jgi:sterol desaturase/sphingolipid hydroxylase (fatty acid hydroxylase superfamily)